MPRYKLIGKKFSYLTVLDYDKEKYEWKCRCDCGKETYREAGELLRRPNGTKSCGCKSWNHGNRMPNFGAAKNIVYKGYTEGAERRNIPFDLTKEEFFSFLDKNCYYCGAVPSNKCVPGQIGYKSDFLYNGVDRVDNSKGYELNNCVTCCFICNRAKASLSLEEWKTWLTRIYKKLILNEL